MTKTVTDNKEQFCFEKENKLSINFDINYSGLRKKWVGFKNYWKDSFELLKVYFKILIKFVELEYQKMNLYLYKKWLEYEVKYVRK